MFMSKGRLSVTFLWNRVWNLWSSLTNWGGFVLLWFD